MLPKFGHMYRLTRDPDTTFGQSGTQITKVGLACSEKYGERETQLFIDAVAFKKTAERLARVQKGHRIFAVGKLQTEQWEDRTSGQRRSKVSMIIESFEFIEPKQQGEYRGQPQGGYQQPTSKTDDGGFQQPPDDGIPF